MPDANPIKLKLRVVRLERFKAVMKTDSVIPLKDFNAIIGRNGAGKSTLIEALQWIDTALRADIQAACARYNGVSDLINRRTTAIQRNFKISLTWDCEGVPESLIEYSIKIGRAADGRTAVILEEKLQVFVQQLRFDLISTVAGERRLFIGIPSEALPFTFRERLLLGTIFGREANDRITPYLKALRDFWSNAVFLRLSPNELAKPAPATRRSYEPMLNETGNNLPTLLRELTSSQKEKLVQAIRQALPNFTGVEVSRPMVPQGEVFFSLSESLPGRGRTGKKKVDLPTWMLSEGTRRITAILAVLQHEPPPSFLCIEEIENGLDPWTVVVILQHLRSASRMNIQILVTTHSPYLLDHMEVSEITLVEREWGNTTYTRFADRDEVKQYKGRVPPGAIYTSEL